MVKCVLGYWLDKCWMSRSEMECKISPYKKVRHRLEEGHDLDELIPTVVIRTTR